MRFDPTITQKVRASLIQDGHSDLVIETLTAGLSEMETELHRVAQSVRLLEIAERERLTQTGVWRFVQTKLDEKVIDWGVWALRGTLAAGGAAAVAILYKLFALRDI